MNDSSLLMVSNFDLRGGAERIVNMIKRAQKLLKVFLKMGSEIIDTYLRRNRENARCYWKVITQLPVGSQMAL